MALGGCLKMGLLLDVVHVVRDKRSLDRLLNVRIWENRLFNEASKFVLGYFGGKRLDLIRKRVAQFLELVTRVNDHLIVQLWEIDLGVLD